MSLLSSMPKINMTEKIPTNKSLLVNLEKTFPRKWHRYAILSSLTSAIFMGAISHESQLSIASAQPRLVSPADNTSISTHTSPKNHVKSSGTTRSTGVSGFNHYWRWVSNGWSAHGAPQNALLTDVKHIITNAAQQIITHPVKSIAQLLSHPSLASLAQAQVPDVVVKAEHPAGGYPVILVHGTGDNPRAYEDLAPALSKAGFDTYTPFIGQGGPTLVGLHPEAGGELPVAVSEQQLAKYIARVQAETGAKKVNLVGHSQGGLLIKDYLAHDTHNNVQAVVDLAASNHGTSAGGIDTVFHVLPGFIRKPVEKLVSFVIGQASLDQLSDANYIKQSDKNPDTVPGVHYLVLSDRDDTTLTPYDSTYLKAVPGADVTNLEIHSLPGVTGVVPHILIPENPGVIAAVTQYIQEKGVPHASSGAPVFSLAESTQQSVTSPTVDLLQ